MQTELNREYFNDYTKTGFGVFSRGRQILVAVGRSGIYCKVSKKNFMQSAKDCKVSGFTILGNPQYIWVTLLEHKEN